MSEDCLFCGIVAGDVPSHTVYEDDEVSAFLDVNPLAEGHTLVVPKEHYERMGDLPAGQAGAVGAAIATIAPAVEDAVGAPASTIAYNNGPEAGQEIDHVHAHVIPRYAGDGAGAVHSLFRERPELAEDDMSAIAADIADLV
jgi:histidine triad (HIT) family protein